MRQIIYERKWELNIVKRSLGKSTKNSKKLKNEIRIKEKGI